MTPEPCPGCHTPIHYARSWATGRLLTLNAHQATTGGYQLHTNHAATLTGGNGHTIHDCGHRIHAAIFRTGRDIHVAPADTAWDRVARALGGRMVGPSDRLAAVRGALEAAGLHIHVIPSEA